MMPASIFAEAIRNEEAIHVARERLATRDGRVLHCALLDDHWLSLTADDGASCTLHLPGKPR